MSLYNRLLLSNRLSNKDNMPYSDFKNRCVGRTTAAALDVISTSIKSPGQKISLADHGGYEHTEHSRAAFASGVKDMIYILDLKDMEVRLSTGGRWVLVNNFSVDL